jgi:hypothetical protein
LLTALGYQVIVANARKIPAITGSESKNDRNDAENLARFAAYDARLLSPIEHRSPERQADLNLIHDRPTSYVDPYGLVDTVNNIQTHIEADIDADCADPQHPGRETAGGCNKVYDTVTDDCEKGDNCKWKVKFTVTLQGSIYVSSGPYPYKGRHPMDRTATGIAGVTAHENGHTQDELNAILPILQAVEGQTFDSREECNQAAINAELQAATAWTQAAAASQRTRH